MYCFPIFSGHHLDRVPRAAVEKSAIRSFADALLAANAEIRINFNPAKRWMILVRNPEHARFYRAVLNARGRTGAAGAAVGRDGEYARLLFPRRLSVANRHGPVFFYNVIHALGFPWAAYSRALAVDFSTATFISSIFRVQLSGRRRVRLVRFIDV